jgi:hypothetical protein
VPYRLIPRTSPRACLKALPSAMALSCRGGNEGGVRYGGAQRAVLICSVMIVNPKVPFTFHVQ